MIYFTSDQHFDHRNIIKYCNRPFSDIDEMRFEIINRFNSKVTTDDLVYHLGDFMFQANKISNILNQLNGNHILIAGNHDKCHPVHKKSANIISKFKDYGFKDVLVSTIIGFDYLGYVLLSHIPPNDCEEERFKQYRPTVPSYVNICITGHVHEKWKLKNNCINVGVDQWDFYPVSLNELARFKQENNL